MSERLDSDEAFRQEMQAKKAALQERLDTLPAADMVEYPDNPDQWEQDIEAMSRGTGIYGKKGSEGIARTAEVLIRLLQAQVAELGDEVTQKDVLDTEAFSDVEGHSGPSFSLVRTMATRHGVGVKELYDRLYPPQPTGKLNKIRRAIGSLSGRRTT